MRPILALVPSLRVGALLALACLSAPSAPAQEVATDATAGAATAATVPVVLPGSDPSLVGEERVRELLERYPGPGAGEAPSEEFAALDGALADVRERVRFAAELEQLEAFVANADDTLARRQEALAELGTADDLEVPGDLDAAERLLGGLNAGLSASGESLSSINSELSGASETRLQDSNRVSAIAESLRLLDARTADGEVAGLAAAARRQRLEAEAAYLERKLAAAETRRSVLTATRELERARSSLLEQQVTELAAAVEAMRSERIRERELEARSVVEQLTMDEPALRALAGRNQQRLEKLREVVDQRTDMQAKFDAYNEKSRDIEALLNTLEQRLQIAGRSASVGALLQRELNQLPARHEVETVQRRIGREIRRIQTDLLEYELELAEDPLSTYPDLRALEAAASDAPPGQRVVAETLEELLSQRKEFLGDLVEEYNRYFELLVAIDAASREVLRDIGEFREFALVNSLWLPDKKILGFRELGALPGFVADVAFYLGRLVVEAVFEGTLRLVAALLAGVLVFLLLVRGDRLVAGMRRQSLSDLRLHHLLVPLALEVLVALYPLLLGLLAAWVLAAPDLDSYLAAPLQAMMVRLAEPTVFAVLVYRLCMDGNLGQHQLGWSRRNRERVRQGLVRFLLPGYLAAFLAGVLNQVEVLSGEPQGSRFIYITTIVFAALCMRKLFEPKEGLLSRHRILIFLAQPRVRHLVHWLLLAWMGALAVLMVLGYMVAVTAFMSRTVQTLWLISMVVIVGSVLVRLMRAERLRSLREWRVERRQSLAFRMAGDLGTWRRARDQSRDMWRILAATAFIAVFVVIWSELLPALHTISNEALIHSGDDVLLTVGQGTRILIAVALTVILAIHLPRLANMLVFSRIGSISRGNRYAISTLLSYFVVLSGVVWVAMITEVRWSEIQWLFAAATVGLSFGLQEIFGNLVAGIMILFERPIRVGDVVTVNNTSGIVTRIRIRSTTIRQYDRTELIVPNKDFITNQVVNWSLSDAITRISIELRIAFEEDSERVTKVLLEALQNCPVVTGDPAPRVIITGVDDYAYRFTCQAFLDKVDNRIGDQDTIYRAIIRALNENDIRIPFPKSDVRFLGPGEQPGAGLRTGGSDSAGAGPVVS